MLNTTPNLSSKLVKVLNPTKDVWYSHCIGQVFLVLYFQGSDMYYFSPYLFFYKGHVEEVLDKDPQYIGVHNLNLQTYA